MHAAVTLLYWLSTTLPGLAVMAAVPTRPGRLGLVGRLAWAFVLSVCLLTPLTVLAYAVQLSVTAVAAVYAVIAAGAVMVIATRFRHQWPRWREPRVVLRTPAMWVALVVVLATLPFPGGSRFDAQMHAAKIRLLLDHGFTLQDPYSPLAVVESKFHVNTLHLLHAVGAQLTGRPPLEFWSDSARYFRLLAFGAVEALALGVFGVSRLAALAMVMTAFFVGLAGADNAVPSVVAGRVLLPLLVLQLARLTVRPSRAALLNAAAASVALGAIHVGNYVVYVVCLVPALAAWSGFLAATGSTPVAPLRALAALAVGAPFLSVTLAQPNHAMAQMQGLFQWELSTHHLGGVVLQMLSITRSLWEVPAAAATAAVFLMRRLQRSAFGLLAAAFAFASQCMYNPLVFGVLSAVVPYWMIRRMGAFAALAAGLVVPALITWLLGRYSRGRMRGAAVAAVLAAAVVAASTTRVSARLVEMAQDREALALAGELRTLGPMLHGDSLIAANADLSLLMPSVVSVTVMGPSLGNANPADGEVLARSAARDRLLAVATPAAERAAIIERYHVDLVVLTRSEATTLSELPWPVVVSSPSLVVLRPPRGR